MSLEVVESKLEYYKSVESEMLSSYIETLNKQLSPESPYTLFKVQ